MGASGRQKKGGPRKASQRGGAKRGPARRSQTKGRKRSTTRARKGARRRVNALKRWRGSPYAKATYWLAVSALWAFGALGLGIFYYSLDLPDTSSLWEVDHRPSITIEDRHGRKVATRGLSYALPVTLSEMPDYLPHAVIATEDRRFYHHVGLDAVGLTRAAFRNWSEGRVVQGGSTITQQLAKNLFLTPERTMKRKIQEVMLAVWLEQRFTKDQILSLYLNRVYLGAGTYGVEAASRRYFGKSVSDVSLSEAALLAGLLKAPSRYSPTNSVTKSKERTEVVLNLMQEAGFITADERARSHKSPPRFAQSQNANSVQYFVDWVVDQARQYTGVDSDVVIRTTLDYDLQIKAEKAIALTVDRDGKSLGFEEAALVSMTPDGEIRALVGGRSYRRSQYNRVTQAKRQPGSAFKPFVYLAGLETGLHPSTKLEDAPIQIGDWSPKNFSETYAGQVTLSEALAKSINSVAIQISERVGRRRVANTAERLGIKSQLSSHPSLALGTAEVNLLELTSAYAPFANGGKKAAPYGISRIETEGGYLLYEAPEPASHQVVSLSHVAAMNNMLGQAMREGTGKKAHLTERPAGGKTGTSQNSRDALFVGYTADLVTGVWVGNDDFRPMKNVTGGRVPTVIWKDFMLAAHRKLPSKPLPGSHLSMSMVNADVKEDEKAGGFLSRLLGGFGPDSADAASQ